jgi:nickel-type superoxide dismutase maturation protease
MSMERSRSRPLVLVLAIAAIASGMAVARRWLDAVEVDGDSMAPTLLPGDRLLVESWSYARRRPRGGEVVLAGDPRLPERELIKRVASIDTGAETVELAGDFPQASTDSRTFGSLPIDSVRWRVALRYWPPGRIGLIG